MKKYLWLALVLVAGSVVLYLVSGPGSAEEKKDAKVVTTDSGLKYQDLKEGTGDAAKSGDVVEVQYTGWLTDDGTTPGKKFDSSKDHGGDPFKFKLGAGRVIKGWDEGVAGMKPGGTRKLIIPSSLGYGDDGSGPIPPKATLIFEVELVRIK
jgi:FKBP-type peptidyl-prolyl cis-trans isomerase FkpA